MTVSPKRLPKRVGRMRYLQRPPKTLVILVVIVILYLVAVYIPDAHVPKYLEKLVPEGSSKIDTEVPPQHAKPEHHEPIINQAPPPKTSEYVDLDLFHPVFAGDAHKFPAANSFYSHFQAVLELPGMTIAETKSTCTWPPTQFVNFQFQAELEWVQQDRPNLEIERRRSSWQDFIRSGLLPYEKYQDRFQGRGIVIVAGNHSTLKRVHVLLKALKRLGSKLPVEIHFWKEEMNDEKRQALLAISPDIHFNDLSDPSNILRTEWAFNGNFQFKTAALINSRFAEPLLLDSDNIPVIDPECLWESATYKEYGTIFWPDIARTWPQNPMWAITNTPCRMDEYEQESGQLLVDKRRFFHHLQLAAWFNQQLDYYYEFLLGDKDMFRFSWHALKTKYGYPRRWLSSVGTVSPDADADNEGGFYCGHSFAQHHPDDGRVAFMHGGLLKTMAREVMRWHRRDRGGIFQAYKSGAHPEDMNATERVQLGWDSAPYLPHRPDDLKVAWCTFFLDAQPHPLDDIAPGFEQTFEDIGGYWMLDDTDGFEGGVK